VGSEGEEGGERSRYELGEGIGVCDGEGRVVDGSKVID